MMPKKKRLNSEAFLSVIKGRALSAHSPHFSIKYLRSSSEAGFSVVVSKKVAKTAVMRNKIRRRVYEALLETRPSPVKVLVFAKNGAEKLHFDEIKAEMSQLLSKIGA